MNEVQFNITEEQKKSLDRLTQNAGLDFIYIPNRTRSGYSITLSAINGKQDKLSDFVDLLKSNGFDV